jgi:hypothetical protein
MGKYELERFKYLMKVSKDERFIQMLTENVANNNQKVASSIALEPNNERELAVAEAVYLYYNAMKTLFEGMAHEDMEDIPFDKNEGIKKYIDIIKRVRDDHANPDTCRDDDSPVDCARADYSFYLARTLNPNEVCQYIGEKIGVHFDYFTAVKEFNDLMKQLGITEKSPMDEELDINNDEQVKFFLEYAKAFDELVKKGKIHHNAERANIVRNIFGRK